MIIRYACRYADGRTVEGEVEFDSSGKGTIIRADDSNIREALEIALSSTLEGETGEYRDGALATVPFVAEPGTILHALGMINPPVLLERCVTVVEIIGDLPWKP